MQKKTFFIAWALFVIAVIAAVAYIATTKLKIQDFGNGEDSSTSEQPQKTVESPIPTASPKPTESETKQYTHQELGYSFSYPSDWTLSTTETQNENFYTNVDVKSPDYKISEGYPVLESGFQLTITAKKTSETSVNTLFENDTLAKQLAKNKKTIQVDGVEALQYEISYEGVLETLTTFINNGVYYQLIYRYPDSNQKESQWNIYETLLTSFKFGA